VASDEEAALIARVSAMLEASQHHREQVIAPLWRDSCAFWETS
jgi:hypothetical protein